MKNNKAPLITFICVMIVFIAGVLWLRALNSTPTIVIPTPVMPSPNAFDSYVAAGKAIVDEKKTDYAISSRHSVSRSEPEDHAYSLAQKDALVAENAHALALLRHGFAFPYLNPPARSFNTAFPYFAKFRGTARLLLLEEQARQGHGDWSGAMDSSLDAVRLGEDVPRGGVLIGMLVGVACQAIGRRPAWNAVDHLTAPQARAAAARLEDIRARHVPYADVLQEEKWSTQAGMLELMRKPNWRRELTGEMDMGGGLQKFVLQTRMMFVSKGQVLRGYTRFMDQLIAAARLPFAAHPPSPTMPSDPVNQMLLPVFDKAGFRDVENETQNALLLTLLALRAYRLEHGTYPDTLNPLVPSCLKRLPDDPFALSGGLHYRRTGNTFVLYSLGPDGKDDGGKPIFDPSTAGSGSSSDRPFWVQQESTGDVVAGVNKT